MKKKVLIWGAGHCCEYVYQGLKESTDVIGIIDSDPKKQGIVWNDRCQIISPEDIKKFDYDYIIVSVIEDGLIEKKCHEMGILDGRMIFYWRDVYADTVLQNRMYRLNSEKRKADIYKARLDSAPYEWGIIPTPDIRPAKDCLDKIIQESCSLCRFGDGEYNIMLNQGNPWFQNSNESLRERLSEIIGERDPKIIVAIAENFKNFDKLTVAAADEIRLYMEGNKRKEILNLLSKDTVYYDAYVSRPYMIYKDKTYAQVIFDLYKKIWNKRKVLIVEGRYTRMGIGNDLFENAADIKRIICPSENAWSCYERIFDKAQKIGKEENRLICITLGPAATVLAYDLGKAGIQAIDIGQLDNEYEWYLQGVQERTEIKGKMVAEIKRHMKPEECICKEYNSQILYEIR